MTGALVFLAAVQACNRAPEAPPRQSAGPADTTIRDDVKDVAKATDKAAKDLGHATLHVADTAGKGLSDATANVGAGSRDAWITTKVKSELTREGFDPLRVHVDTNAKVVILSGTVDSAAQRDKAVSLARAVTDVASVTDHLFVEPARK